MIFSFKHSSAFFVLTAVLLNACGPGARNGYRIENGQVVLYTGFPATKSILTNADAKSFKALNHNYGKDKHSVFYLSNVIKDADAKTFTYLGGSYSKDKNSGYSREIVISNDGPHFGIVPNPDEKPDNVTANGIVYARDSRKVYRDVMPLPGADPRTFTFVPMFNGYYLTKDKRFVYFQDKPMPGIDGASFHKISDFHFADRSGAWALVTGKDVTWNQIADVDLKTFAGIGRNYAKDSKRVYFSDNRVNDADTDTFRETGYLQASDKNGNYSSGNLSPEKTN
jgi:hypothetical protein